MESFLTNFSELHRTLSYIIVFLSIFIEGEIVLMVAGVLSHRGLLDISNVIIVASGAAILHDLLFWHLGGKLLKTNRSKIFFVNLDRVKGFLDRLRLNDGVYIFVSKFAWNLNRIILVAAGYLKMPVQELLRFSVAASVVWSITFVSLGYVFASETHILKTDVKTATIAVSAFIIIIIGLENLLRRQIEKRTKK